LQYQGQAYDVIFLEEATQFTEFQFNTLTESNRSSGMMKIKFSPRMYFTMNPGGVGHVWVKRLFIDRDYRNKEKADNYEFIQSLVYDNDYLMENNPEYVENLENLPEDRKKAMLYGDWDAFEGQYFNEFNRQLHVIEPFVIPSHWRRYITLDYGLDMLACLWNAIDEQGNAYVYKELYESNLIISEAAKRIKEVNGADKIDLHYAPPDLWNRRQDTGRSAAEIFAECGVALIKAGNSRIDGWLNVKEYLRTDKGKPHMMFFSTCTPLLRCLPLLRHDTARTGDVATEPHDLTHSPDALRYWCSRRQLSTVMNTAPVSEAFASRKNNGIESVDAYLLGGFES
jgi:phage terminase large subunit